MWFDQAQTVEKGYFELNSRWLSGPYTMLCSTKHPFFLQFQWHFLHSATEPFSDQTWSVRPSTDAAFHIPVDPNESMDVNFSLNRFD